MTIHTILILSVFYVINFFDLVVRSTSSGLPFIIIFIFINYVIFICRSQFEDHILSLYHIHIDKYIRIASNDLFGLVCNLKIWWRQVCSSLPVMFFHLDVEIVPRWYQHQPCHLNYHTVFRISVESPLPDGRACS